MLPVYLFCLVLGGGFLALSVLGDAFGDAGDVELDADLDADAGDTHASRILSIRSVIYALFGFGATGTALTWLTPSLPGGVRVALAVAGGLVTGALITGLFRWLKTTESGEQADDRGFVGLPGTVVLPLSPGTPGTVAVERGARRYTLRALPHGDTGAPEAEVEGWRQVVVVDMSDGVARVAPVDGALSLEP